MIKKENKYHQVNFQPVGWVSLSLSLSVSLFVSSSSFFYYYLSSSLIYFFFSVSLEKITTPIGHGT